MNTTTEHKEIRFKINRDTTDAYVFISITEGPWMLGVEGWHHKAFSKEMSCIDILNSMIKESALLWPIAAPPIN